MLRCVEQPVKKCPLLSKSSDSEYAETPHCQKRNDIGNWLLMLLLPVAEQKKEKKSVFETTHLTNIGNLTSYKEWLSAQPTNFIRCTPLCLCIEQKWKKKNEKKNYGRFLHVILCLCAYA